MATYRGTVQTNVHPQRLMVPPGFSFEARKGRAAWDAAIKRLSALMAQHAPEVGAWALLECSDAYGPRTLARYEGVTTKRSDRGGPVAGVWTLKQPHPDGAPAPSSVEAS